jgi:hypothetical protein
METIDADSRSPKFAAQLEPGAEAGVSIDDRQKRNRQKRKQQSASHPPPWVARCSGPRWKGNRRQAEWKRP